MLVCYLSGFSIRFQKLSRAHGQVTYVLLTRSPLDSEKQAFLPLVRLACIRHYQIVGTADWHDAEKEKYQQVAQSQIAQLGGIEEAEEYAADTHDDHLLSSVEGEGQTDGASQKGGEDDAPFHGFHRNPAFGAGSLWPQSGFVVVAMLEVEEVVYQV